ncbi:MAG: hypothetical protein KGS61_01660, partial [Verrucomicrobia bacterium]|nr:hypothetical protein [Verrucomicrobiota bacterium]
IYYRRIQWSGTTASWADSSSQQLTNWGSAPEYYDFDDATSTLPLAPEGSSCSYSIELYRDGSRLQMATIRNGYLWTCQYVGLSGTGGSYSGTDTGAAVDRSGIQWWQLQLNSSGTPLTYVRSGMVYDSASSNPWWYYMPSLAVNWQNQAVLGFSGSSANNYIGAFYTWVMGNGATLGSNVVLTNGSSCAAIWWGDYSFTTVDPMDNQTIWTIQGFASNEGGPPYCWSDWIASVKPGP